MQVEYCVESSIQMSYAVALLGGLICVTWGYQFVFLLGAVIAVLNFFSALSVRTR